MSSPKLHHITPRVYLSFFSIDGVNIFRYDKQRCEVKALPILVTGAIKDFYTITDQEGNRDTFIESPLLSDIDGQYKALISRLESCVALKDVKNYLVELISSQASRVEKPRDRQRRRMENMNAQRRDLSVPEDNLEKVDNSNLNFAMLAEMSVYSGVASNSFFVVFLSSGSEFITCDNPADKAFLPLTTTMCLSMPSVKPSIEYVSGDDILVDKINRMTFDKATRYVYARTREALEMLLNE